MQYLSFDLPRKSNRADYGQNVLPERTDAVYSGPMLEMPIVRIFRTAQHQFRAPPFWGCISQQANIDASALLPQQLRQLGEIDRQPPRRALGQQIGGRAPASMQRIKPDQDPEAEFTATATSVRKRSDTVAAGWCSLLCRSDSH